MRKKQWIAGVDEAGRGPLAGPVAVGVAVVPIGFDWNLLPGVGDSKKVTPERRGAILRHAKILKRDGLIDFCVVLVPHTTIDRVGISRAVKQGIERCFKKLALNPLLTSVKLDGLLHAPELFKDQETIIKGDAKERVIGLASIVAKVTRDEHMIRVAKKYPQYGFEIHKGYGTKAHCASLRKNGLSLMHRRTFCKRFLQ